MNTFGLLSIALGSAIALSACGSGAGKPSASSVSSPVVSATPAATLAAQATPATNPAAREMGPVTAINGSTVTLQDGSTFMLASQTAVTRRADATPSDIQKGTYVAVTAKRQQDNSLLASQVVLFDSASASFYRQFPMDAGNIMTNAAVDQVNGSSFTVTWPGGGEHVTLAPDAKLSKVAKASTTDVKVGETVSVSVNGNVAQSVSIQ